MSVLAHALLAAVRAGAAGVIVNEHTPSAADIRAHVETLGPHVDFVHHDDLLARLARPGRRPFCLLTFDDGKRSNAVAVAPELERLGVPGVFYVVTRYLRDGVPLWFDRYRALRKVAGPRPPGLEPEVVKALPQALRDARLDPACAAHGVDPRGDDDVDAMSWDDARALAARGFTIGAHTLHHPVLTCEREADAFEEIGASIAEVSAALGTPCTTFAFPNGNYTARLASHALRCGVDTVVTTEPLWVDATFPAWRLPRVQLHPHQRADAIAAKLVAARLGLLSDPNGTGRAYRTVQRLARRRRHQPRPTPA